VNNGPQRNLMTFIASSVLAGMLVGTVSAHSPRDTGDDTKATLEAETSKGVSRDTVSKVPVDDDVNSSKQDHPSDLADYAYSEVLPAKKPAEIVLDSLKDVPIGTPIEEIKRASDAFGLDFNFMKTVARIESDFDPNQRTGSYIGLFQLSKQEFARHGSGDILNARDNAVAAAHKFATAAILFELNTHKSATFSDLYLIHQQGTQGAEEHVNHPDRIAWKSMCATAEGKEKGEEWCKRAIWENTLPEIKRVWKSVDNLTSGVFLNMWQNQVDHFYAHYSDVHNTEMETSGSVTAEFDHTQSFAATNARFFANDQLETPRTALGRGRAKSVNGPAVAEAPWGIQLFGGSSQISVLASYHQLQRKYAAVLASRQPLVIRSQAGRNASWYRVRITAQTFAEAELLCGTLREAGGSCLVQRN
jgi:SPOR domain